MGKHRLNFNKNYIESFALKTLQKYFKDDYIDFYLPKTTDGFDILNIDLNHFIEVTSVISKNTENVLEYESSLDRKGKADLSRIKQAIVDNEGELLIYLGGSLDEYKDKILKQLDKKNKKLQKRYNKDNNIYELFICVDDGGLFSIEKDINFLINSKEYKSSKFNRIFVATMTKFFIIQNSKIIIIDRNK